MSIPKVIYQTFKTKNLPWLTNFYIKRFRKLNPNYEYYFFDDEGIDDFFRLNYSEEIYSQYKRINIGAMKADFFRYALLYKKGGIYLDIDSLISKNLDSLILDTDTAIISEESNPGLFVQWALIYEANHPFLRRTIEKVTENLKTNRYPNSVHKMTGPTVYSESIKECISENNAIPYRLLGVDYEGYFKFKYPFSKFLLYPKGGHWKKSENQIPLLK